MEPFFYILTAVLIWAFMPPIVIYVFTRIKSEGFDFIIKKSRFILFNVIIVSGIFLIIRFIFHSETNIIEKEGLSSENYSSYEQIETDQIVFWTWEEFGSPQEKFLIEAVRLWNENHPKVKVIHQNQSYSGYRDKLKLSIAAGIPPDVAVAGIDDLGSLERNNEMPELSVAIPDEMLSDQELDNYGSMVVNSITRKGKRWVLPLFKYMYGGFMSANKRLLNDAGYDENTLLEKGWTIDEFRLACKKLTQDIDGDGKIDIFGFGTPLKNLRAFFLNELGPSYWGIEKVKTWRGLFVVFNDQKDKWERDPELKKEDFSIPMRTIYQMIYEDKSFGMKYLGMVHNQITKELMNKQTLAMTWSGAPQVYVQNAKLHNQDIRNGLIEGKPLDIVVMQSPRFSDDGHPVFTVGVTGYSVFKQNPYKGDNHTRNSLLFAKYISSPIMVSYFQYRTRGAFPPPSSKTTEIFHNIIDYELPQWRPYKLFFDSPHAWTPTEEVIFPKQSDRRGITLLWRDWLEQRGFTLLEAIALKEMTPEVAGKEWFDNIENVVNKYYKDK